MVVGHEARVMRMTAYKGHLWPNSTRTLGKDKLISTCYSMSTQGRTRKCSISPNSVARPPTLWTDNRR